MPEFLPTHPDQVGLREHLETLLVGLRHQVEARNAVSDARFSRNEQLLEESVKLCFVAMDKLDSVMLERLSAARTEITLINTAQQIAVNKADDAMNKRLDSMNQFREQLTAQSNMFSTREMLDQKVSALDKMIDARANANSDRIGRLESKSSNLDGRFWAIGALVVVVNVMIAVAGLMLRGFQGR